MFDEALLGKGFGGHGIYSMSGFSVVPGGGPASSEGNLGVKY